MYQNINHLSENKNTSKSNDIVRFASNNDIDVMLMSEIGLRWDRVDATDQWSERIYGLVDKENHVFAYNRNEKGGTSATQYGGTGISVIGDCTHRIIGKGQDESGLGRWSWVRMKGRNEFYIRIISAYRPCAPAGIESVARQQERHFHSIGVYTDPRAKMLEDLIQECNKWIEQGDRIILGMDANDDVRTSMNVVKEELGLIDVVLDNHNGSPPATHNKNTQRVPIDGIWASASLAIKQAGYLPFDEGIPSDHRAIWVDFAYQEVFGFAYPPLACPSRRKLKANDPRMVRRYCNEVALRLIKEDIPRKLADVEFLACRNGWNQVLENEFNFLHRRNIDIRRNIEKHLRKFKMGAVPWSPKLQVFRDKITMWSMVCKKRKGIKTSTRKIRRLMKKTRSWEALKCNYEEACNELDNAFNDYRRAKKDADMWRDDFIHNLAKALAEKKGTRKESELKSLVHIDRQKRQAHGIKRVQNKIQDLACHKIQVGLGDNIETVDTKKEVEYAFINENIRKFTQTKDTPPMTEPLRSILGEYGETSDVDKILNGEFTAPEDLDPLVKDFLKVLKWSPEIKERITRRNDGISTETHVQGWGKQKESISAEPSSLSFSHYKAGIHDQVIAETDAMFRSIPFQFGFSPKEWERITDVQILKKAGVYHVAKMRTIMLMQSEFNMSNKLVGKIMMENAERLGLLAMEQFGSRKHHQSVAAALNKKLTFDLLRQRRLSGAICANDAKSCYDRIVHNIAAICMIRAGAPKEAVWSMFQTLRNSIHVIKTAFGISEMSYGSKDDITIQGIRQGNGCGPAAWAAISTPIIEVMRSKGHGFKFASALSNEINDFICYAFVDDTDLIISAKSIIEDAVVTMDRLQRMASDWDDVLYITGGAIVPEKSYWTYVNLEWKNENWRYKKINEAPGEILLKDPITRTPKAIKRLEPSESEESLGIFLAADGNLKAQVNKLKKKSQIFGQCMRTGMISKFDANFAIRSTLMKTMEYPLIAIDICKKDWNSIISPALQATLPKMGFVRTIPRVLVFGPKAAGGLGLHNLWHQQHIKQMHYMLSEIYRSSIAMKLLVSSLEELILESGLGSKTWEWPMEVVKKYVTKSWWVSLIEYMNQNKFRFDNDTKDAKPVSPSDKRLMAEIIKYEWSTKDIRIINECRMSLKATFLSDIVAVDGKSILNWAWNGKGQATTADWKWPKAAHLTGRHWRIWQKALKTAFLRNGTSFKISKFTIDSWDTTIWDQQNGKYWIDSGTEGKILFGSRDGWDVYVSNQRRGHNLRRRRYSCSTERTTVTPNTVKIISVEFSENLGQVIALNHRANDSAVIDDSFLVNTVDSNLQKLHNETPWTWEEIYGPDNIENIVQSIRYGLLYAVSDGSYLDGIGTSASILDDGNGSRMWCLSRTPGAFKYQNSHRSELAGIVASLTMLSAVCLSYNIEMGKATICLDGKQAINNIKREHLMPDAADYDMILQIKELIRRIPIYIEFEWVKGHQDDDVPFHKLSYQAQLNVLADNKAKEFLKRNILSFRPDPALVFPSEKWSITRNGEKFSSFDPLIVYESVVSQEIKEYWCEKGNIDNSLLHELDWENFGKFFMACSFAQQRRIIKLTSGHAPVAKMMLRWKKQDHSRCPLCGNENEDVHHVLTCCSIAARSEWDKQLLVLQESLTAADTYPAITSEVMRQLRHWRKYPNQQPLEPQNLDDWELRRCVQHQNRIGWENFLKGRVSILWGRRQQHYLSQVNSRRTGNTWARRLMKASWTCIWGIWDCRNFGKHHTVTPALKAEIALLDERIHEQYRQGCSDLLSSDFMLMDDPIEEILECHVDYKRNWLASISAARGKFHHRQQEHHVSLEASRQNMTQWLHPAV